MQYVKKEPNSSYDKWLFFTWLYLLVDYCRPQDVFPVLGYLRPGIIVSSILVYYLFKHRQLKFALSKQTRLILYFAVLLCLHIPFAVNNFLAYTTAKTIILYLPFIFSVIITVDSLERLKKFLNINLIFMNYVLIYGILHQGRGSGNYFTDENDIALYACIWIPIAFYLFLSEKGKIRAFYAMSFIVGVSNVVVSFSRGGFVGLVCVFIVIWIFSPKKMISLMIVLIVAGGIWFFSGNKYKTEMATVTDVKEGTATERLQSWKAGWNMFLDNPLGVGGNNFQILFPEYQPPEMLKNMWGRVAHSLWFTLIPELGIVGIIIYMLLLYYNMKDILFIKRSSQDVENPDLKFLNHLALAYYGSFAGFFAAATFLSVLYYAHYWYITAYIIATKNIIKSYKNKK